MATHPHTSVPEAKESLSNQITKMAQEDLGEGRVRRGFKPISRVFRHHPEKVSRVGSLYEQKKVSRREAREQISLHAHGSIIPVKYCFLPNSPYSFKKSRIRTP